MHPCDAITSGPNEALRQDAAPTRPLLPNWFAAKGEIALGVVEGMNTNAKLAIGKARGFRTYDDLETALYHELGRLPEPVCTHRFC